MRAAGIAAYDGWHAWRVDRLGGKLLNDLRIEFLEREAKANAT